MRFILGVLLMTLLSSWVTAQPPPTNEWVNFLSANTTLDGSPIPVGAVVDAYDPDGVWCGTFTVHTAGEYGFLLVYRDDTTTPDVDEGASPGDTITFYINGHFAIPLGPGAPVWTSNGDVLQLDLEGLSNYSPVITSEPDTIAYVDSLYTYPVTASDIDRDSLNYRLIEAAYWLSIDIATGLIRGIPSLDDVGYTTVAVEVADSKGGTDSQTYTLNVLEPVGIGEKDNMDLPDRYILEQNYPNPFNPITTIGYALPRSGEATLIVYNLRGEELASLVDSKQTAGNHEVTWDASNVASGLYFYRLQARDFVQTRKMLLLK